MVLVYLVILALAYMLLLFWIVIAVQETTRKYVSLSHETRHISVKKKRGKRKYVIRVG